MPAAAILILGTVTTLLIAAAGSEPAVDVVTEYVVRAAAGGAGDPAGDPAGGGGGGGMGMGIGGAGAGVIAASIFT